MSHIHPSPYAGQWYPAVALHLQDLLDSLAARSRERTGAALWPNPLAFVVPHAGPQYSGAVAWSAYRYLEAARPRRVFLLGFSHSRLHSFVARPDVEAYSTPLGSVPVARADLPFRTLPESLLCDHSLEIQLPFLRAAAPDVPVVPLYIGALSSAARAEAAAALAAAYEPGDLFIASSDFTHYGRDFGYTPFPVNSQTPARLDELDHSLIDAASSLDEQLFARRLDAAQSTLCGREPIRLLLATLARLPGPEIFQCELDYETSGHITGDFHHAVSYAALGYFHADSFYLAPAEQQLLLASARETLVQYAETGNRVPISPPELTPALRRRAAAFVSIHSRGELRGCIGHIDFDRELATLIPTLTLEAALDDPRFSHDAPLNPSELDIEISLLTPRKLIPDPSRFVLHEHGLILQSQLRRALLLPQVATEYNLTRDQFLAALARKASAPPSVFSHRDTTLHIFRTSRMGTA